MTEILTPAAGGGPLLTYGLEVKPDPLQAGSRAEMILVMSNASGDRIACRSIQLAFPVGTDATDLTDGAPVATKPAPDWTVNPDTSGGVVTFTAPGGSVEIGGDGLVFTIVTTANAQPGTATMTLVETASDTDDPLQQRSGTFTFNKFPADFSLSDLTPVPVDKLDYASSETAKLNWVATGDGVSCRLDYQPAESGTPISIDVPNNPKGGAFWTERLTRSEGVVFTLTAKVDALGQDNPLVAQRQLAVTVEAMSLTMSVLPPKVGPNGLVMQKWIAPNADHCVLDDGSIVPPSGFRYIVLKATRLFTVTAVAADGQTKEQQAIVTVDPAIVATEAGQSKIGARGSDGVPLVDHMTWFQSPGNGGNGEDANLRVSLPPLDTSGLAARVIPIVVTGGAGGTGGLGGDDHEGVNYFASGNGGNGGNVSLTATFDGAMDPPAQFLIALTPGSAGSGGATITPGATGSAGSIVAATVDGHNLAFG